MTVKGAVTSKSEGTLIFGGDSTTLTGETPATAPQGTYIVGNAGKMEFNAATTNITGNVNTEGATAETTFSDGDVTVTGSVGVGADAKLTLTDGVKTATITGKIDNQGTASIGGGNVTVTNQTGDAIVNDGKMTFNSGTLTVGVGNTAAQDALVNNADSEVEFNNRQTTFNAGMTNNGKATFNSTNTEIGASTLLRAGSETTFNGDSAKIAGGFLQNKGTAVFNSANTEIAVDGSGLVNQGSMEFSGSDTVKITGTVGNTDSLKFSNPNQKTTIVGDVNNTSGTAEFASDTTDITGIIGNTGESVKFTGRETNIRGNVGNQAGEMLFSGATTNITGNLGNQAGEVRFSGTAANITGNVTTMAGAVTTFAGNKTTISGKIGNAGAINVTGGLDLQGDASGVAIENDGGTLTIAKDAAHADAAQSIRGSIAHGPGATTNITLSGADSQFVGDIIGAGANNANGFALNLDNNAVWQYSAAQEALGAVSNVRLSGGASIVSQNVVTGGANYSKLTLNNFNGDGTGNIDLATDLTNSTGDQVAFTGASDGAVGVRLADKHSMAELAGKDIDFTVVTEGADAVDVSVYAPDGYDPETGYHYSVDLIQREGGQIAITSASIKKDHAKPIQRSHEDGKIINGADLENVFRRLNDLRANPEDAGVWVRMDRNRTDVKDNKYNMTAIGGGYDWLADGDASRFYYGFGGGYASASGETGALGDGRATSGQLYGSWTGKKNNDYLDLVVKYGKLRENYAGLDEFGWYSGGNYRKDLMALSLKYGRRIQTGGGFYFEPQLGYTYGSVGSADYTDSDGARVHADRMNSHIFNVGIQAGQRVKDTEFYGRLSYFYDTDGKMNLNAYNGNLRVTDDLGGGFVRAVIGISHKIDDLNCLYLDLGRDFGNTIERPYSVSLGFSCAF